MSTTDLAAAKRRARLLQRAIRAGDTAAIERVRRFVAIEDPARFPLTAAQFVVAREDGYPSWPRLKARVELLAAIEFGRLDEVRRLVSRGVDHTSPGPDGRTPAWYAAGNHPMQEYLFSPDATGDPEAVAGVRELMGAVFRGEHDTIEALVARNPAVVPEARRMWPKAIEAAAASRRPDKVALLARLGFDVNAAVQLIIGAGPHDWSPLHQAVRRRDAGMVRLLLSLGADPRARSDWGAVLDFARDANDPEILALLQR